MIFLPNTPIIPTPLRTDRVLDDADFLHTRIALNNSLLENQNMLIRYVVNVEEYLDHIITYLKRNSDNNGLTGALSLASNLILMEGSDIPWNGLIQKKPQASAQQTLSWRLSAEIEAVTLSIALSYINLGSDIANELIEIESDLDTDINEKWQGALKNFKKAISFIEFGELFRKSLNVEQLRLNEKVFVFVKKIGYLCIQMATLSKSAWYNRLNYNKSEAFVSKNNGLLARVSVYIVDEIRVCKKIVGDLQVGTLATLNCKGWPNYFQIVEKYSTAYAGLFLSIENYQKMNLGYALGLINFSLLTLQGKKFADITQGKFMKTLKSKISTKRSNNYINNLQSITTLNLDKSVFLDKNGIILKDLSYLFDQLILLRLKLSKENDNLQFQKVTDIQDIGVDSKWPLGSKIPMSDIKPFDPFKEEEINSKEYLGKGAYY